MKKILLFIALFLLLITCEKDPVPTYNVEYVFEYVNPDTIERKSIYIYLEDCQLNVTDTLFANAYYLDSSQLDSITSNHKGLKVAQLFYKPGETSKTISFEAKRGDLLGFFRYFYTITGSGTRSFIEVNDENVKRTYMYLKVTKYLNGVQQPNPSYEVFEGYKIK